MKRASIVLPFVLCVFALVACRESSPMPPGNWTGRCPAPEANAPTEFGPAPTKFIRDRAHIFTDVYISKMEKYLRDFQQETCHQISVVTVADLEGQSLESYAANYANRVGLGYRRLNNGVMLVVAHKLNQARIQIGCGLEDVITDAEANAIMQKQLLPARSEGGWQDAVQVSVNALMELARKKPIAEQFRPKGCRAPQSAAK